MNFAIADRAVRRPMSFALPAFILLGLAACGGGGSGGSDLSGGGGGGGGGATANSVAIVVDSGPTASSPVQNLGYVTVTLCSPGTSTCQTIDHVQIDTGSVGFRVLSAALTLQLPAVNASNGNPLAECVQYVDGFTFGSVRKADLKIAGEVASGIPIQVIGDLENSIPTACNNTTTDPNSGGEEDTVASFGAKGILGVQQFLADVGTTSAADGTEYSSCTTAATPVCTPISLETGAQIPNPVAKFPSDNNGVVIAFPTSGCKPASVPPINSQGANPSSGGVSCGGTLYFGIGTQADNALPSTVAIYTIDPNYADLTWASLNVTFQGAALPYSYIDAGTSALYFPDNAGVTPALCTDASEFYCPASLLAETEEIQGFSNGTNSMQSFSVGNADAIFNSTNAFQPFIVGDSGANSGTFVNGLPFFYGRTVYVGFDGSSFGGVAGPLYAF